MNIYVVEDKWRVYMLTLGGFGNVVDISDKEYADFRRVKGEFSAWQDKLAALKEAGTK